MNSAESDALPCPVCHEMSDSLKQLRVLHTIIAFPVGATFSSAIVRSCPSCMRTYVWRRCRINGLTTWIVGYIVLIPYTLALTLSTFQKGHSWPVKRGITLEMQLNRTWVYEPSPFEKALALIAILFCVLPGIGMLVCWCLLWRVRWCTGWVYKTVEIASFVAFFATIITLGLFIDRRWENPPR